jgi:O-antigen/teichoic acid export membrane protein
LYNFIKKIPKEHIVTGAALISKIITALFQLASIRILTDNLDLNEYAIFSIMLGLTGWFLLSDFGIGASIQNYISEFRAQDQNADKYIKISILMSLITLVMMMLLLWIFSPLLSELLLGKFMSDESAESHLLIFISGGLLLLISIGNVIYKIWYAQMKGYFSNIIPGLSSILSFIALYFVLQFNVENKLYWSIATFFAPAGVLNIISLIRVYLVHNTKICFSDFWIVSIIGKRAVRFWTISIMATLVLQIDYIVMSQLLGPKDVVVYNITTKVFALAMFVYNAMLMAVWPLVSEYHVKRDINNIFNLIKKYLLVGQVAIFTFTLAFELLKNNILKILSPELNLHIPSILIILLGIYFLLRIWTDTFAMVLQSANILKLFWIWTPIQGILNIFLQVMFTKEYGVYGIVLGLIFSYILSAVWVLPKYTFNYFYKLKVEQNDN